MSRFCKLHWDQLKEHLNGKAYVLQDNGNTLIVLIDPSDAGPSAGAGSPNRGGAWKRVREPCLMHIGPSRSQYPRVVN